MKLYVTFFIFIVITSASFNALSQSLSGEMTDYDNKSYTVSFKLKKTDNATDVTSLLNKKGKTYVTTSDPQVFIPAGWSILSKSEIKNENNNAASSYYIITLKMEQDTYMRTLWKNVRRIKFDY
ncbi:MAG: hypothetical protein NZ529_09100 [Cytophagaceae bacterium]|nr:hypothetical protein [Cytophagaceae bacterium]MDW8456941.1 hypothetical protein [Cytophagaceae bacterium]